MDKAIRRAHGLLYQSLQLVRGGGTSSFCCQVERENDGILDGKDVYRVQHIKKITHKPISGPYLLLF